jgi:hypothetical protein
MATLFNTKIKDTYQSLLKLEDNTILTTTTKNITDGLGNASPLFMSTTRVGIGTNNPIATLDVNGAARINGALTLPQNNAVFLTVGTFTWFADGNNILRLVSGGLNRLNLGTDGVLTTNAYYGEQIGSNTNPETYSYSIAGNLQVNGVNRNLSNVNKNIFLAQTTGVGSVQNAPILRYFYAVKGAVTGFTSYRGIEIADLDSYFGTTSGNVMIGTTTDAGERLQVNGTARVGSTLQLDNGLITWGNLSGAPTSRLRITRRTGWGTETGIEIGALNSNTSAFVSKPIVLGDLNTLADVGCLIVGTGNNIQQNASTIIGSGNSVPNTGASTSKQIILGDGNTANGYTNGQVPGIIVGYGNTQNSFAFSQMYGTLLKPYADGQLLFGANAGPVNPSIREVFIGYGYRNEQTSGNQDNGNGNNLLISPSNASDATDKNGGNLTLAGSRGTGAGTPGSIIFSTSTALTSGSTLQTLSEKMRVNSSGNVLIGTNVDTGFRLEVAGDIRGGLLRLSSLTGGGTAFIIVDDNGTVIRSAGWNYDRVTLNTWVNGSQQISSALTLNSTTTGFLAPRMTTTQKNAIASPATGLQVFDITMNAMCEYNGTAWRVVSAGKQTINATTGATTIDLSAGNVADVTLTLSTVITLTNPTVGTYVIKLIQDAIGGKVVSWPFNVLWSGGTPPTLTATANKTDVITLMYDGVNYYGTYALNF